MTQRSTTALAALVPALFAVWLCWPTRNGGLLGDDLVLAGYLADEGPLGLEVAWRRVIEDFTGPWVFGGEHYYRPLVTLTLALDQQVSGGAEWMMRCTNIALFGLCAWSVAMLCGVLCGPWAAIAGGVLFAAHPAGHETVCWPCARADLMVSIAIALACAAFVRHLRGEPGRHLTWAVAAAALGLLCKESALLLAPLFVLLDLAVRGRAVRLRDRLTLHASLGALWLAYAALRWCLLEPLPDPTAAGSMPWSQWWELQLSRLQVMVVPTGSRLPGTAPFTCGALMAWVAFGGVRWREDRRWLAVAAGWIAIAFVPVQYLPVTANFNNGRALMLAWMGLVVASSAVLAASATPRWFRVAGAVLLVIATADLVRGTWSMQAAYDSNWQRMASLRAQLDVAATKATAAEPLLMVAANLGADPDLPFLPLYQAHALMEPPLARAHHPFVAFGIDDDVQQLRGEAAPWRMLWQQGATVCYWVARGNGGELVTIGKPEPGVAATFVAGSAGFVANGGAVSPWPIAGVELVADAPFDAGRLVWRSSLGSVGEVPIGTSRAVDGEHRAAIDLTEDFGFLVFGTMGGIESLQCVFPASAPVHVRAVHVLPPRPPAPLRSTLRGAPVALDELARRLSWDSVPADAEADSIAVVLMNKRLGWRMRGPDCGAASVPPVVAERLRVLDRVSSRDCIWYYLEARAGGRWWRSQVDWFERMRR